MDDKQRLWGIEHVGGELYALRNNGGKDAFDLKLRLEGSAVIFNSREWSTSFSELPAGDSFEFIYQSAWGAEENPPILHVDCRFVHNGTPVVTRSAVPLPY